MTSIAYVTTAFPTQTFFLENEIHRLLARGVRVRVLRLRGPGENVQPEHRALEAVTTSVGSPFDPRGWAALAGWLARRPEVLRVLHPAFEGSPGHEHWRSTCNGAAAGLFSILIDPRYTAAQVDAFVDALTLFKIGYSWAGPVSLVVPYDLGAMRGAARGGLHGHLVRFSMGFEAVADLQADIAQAMAAALGTA